MTRITRVVSTLGLAILATASCDRSSEYAEPPASSYTVARFTLVSESVDSIAGAAVSPQFFAASNVRPLLGRLFLQSEYEAVAKPVVVISDELWRRRFKRAPQIIGTTVQLNGAPTVIIGVAPPGFSSPSGAVVWVPRVPR